MHTEHPIYPTIESFASAGFKPDRYMPYRIERFVDADSDPIVVGYAWIDDDDFDATLDAISAQVGHACQAVEFKS